ncbi:MAG: helix-turn-helix transcriptional regulator [Oscillospiraceae bacterium]|jgi:ArsR family transcriptional regulator|nr:helix-turn-helix transcriptional regulator [Oscillospiraceae bacterium]MBQ5712491.1 helix-turn-helix transcriptional regulator [Oscillospiraceae bacterium]
MERIPEKETMEEISELFKAFADPTRVHILMLLEQRQELCVGDLTEAVGLTQSAVSHQLRILKQLHLVKFRRDGKNLWYALADDHVRTILQMGLEHVME